MNSEKTVKKFDNLKKNLIKDGYKNDIIYDFNENKLEGRINNKKIIKKITLEVNSNKKEIKENKINFTKLEEINNTTNNSTTKINIINFGENYSKIFSNNLKDINLFCINIKKLELEKKDFEEKLKNFINKIQSKKHSNNYYKGAKVGFLGRLESSVKNREIHNKKVISESMNYAKFYLYKIYEKSKEIITKKIEIQKKIDINNRLANNLNKDILNKDIENEVTKINSFILNKIIELKEL